MLTILFDFTLIFVMSLSAGAFCYRAGQGQGEKDINLTYAVLAFFLMLLEMFRLYASLSEFLSAGH